MRLAGVVLRARGALVLAAATAIAAAASPAQRPVPKFERPRSGLVLERPSRPGAFFDVVGRRAAVLGYENRTLEAWAYPLKLLDDFELFFRLQGYPLEFAARDLAVAVEVRPEGTTFTHAHAGFTARLTVFAPIDEPGILVLLDVRSALPLTVIGSFRPRLRLMWPAGLMTGNVSWDEEAQIYTITEETRRFAAVVGIPGARDLSVMPYQEEPRDVPIRFSVDVPLQAMGTHLVPIVFAGSVDGLDSARATAERLLTSAPRLYEETAAHYRALQERTVAVDTPDERLDQAFAWAKVGIDKGLARIPGLGTGLLAGFRTSGASERPGFAWPFGRDALWTALAATAYGDEDLTGAALEFLARHQRKDGKIPHEISQSAALIPWFEEYPYPWNAADATPLFVIAHAERFAATGNLGLLQRSWPSIVQAWRFTAATDTDGNGLVENTTFGHGWVEGGDLYPPHEEIYLQGVWIQACLSLADLAERLGEAELAAEARRQAERTRAATEGTYWLPGRGFYAYATQRPREEAKRAEEGPRRQARQGRLDTLAGERLFDEDTVLPAVPLWWHLLEDARAQSEIDHLGRAALATDWGTRLLAHTSELYDPLSYHHGSVWPLFTGWVGMAAYGYGRPHVGYQALMANALLTEQDALGYVTELLSGDFNTAFGRSSHHQIWSQAMVATPLLRGLLGVEVTGESRTLRFAPQLPADWDRVAVSKVPVRGGRCDLVLERSQGRITVEADRSPGAGGLTRLILAPGLPLDARVKAVIVGGRPVSARIERVGDVQRAEITVENPPPTLKAVYQLDEGTDVFLPPLPASPGAESAGLRVLSARASETGLRLRLEGRAGRSYRLGLRTPRRPGEASGLAVRRIAKGEWELRVDFEGAEDAYVRRNITLPLSPRE